MTATFWFAEPPKLNGNFEEFRPPPQLHLPSIVLFKSSETKGAYDLVVSFKRSLHHHLATDMSSTIQQVERQRGLQHTISIHPKATPARHWYQDSAHEEQKNNDTINKIPSNPLLVSQPPLIRTCWVFVAPRMWICCSHLLKRMMDAATVILLLLFHCRDDDRVSSVQTQYFSFIKQQPPSF